MAVDYQRQSAREEMKKAFAVFDEDGDGFIDGRDIKRTMATLGETISERDVASMVAEADIDGDGRINFKGMFPGSQVAGIVSQNRSKGIPVG